MSYPRCSRNYSIDTLNALLAKLVIIVTLFQYKLIHRMTKVTLALFTLSISLYQTDINGDFGIHRDFEKNWRLIGCQYTLSLCAWPWPSTTMTRKIDSLSTYKHILPINHWDELTTYSWAWLSHNIVNSSK